ncbi:MAG: hypothetical protein J5993_01700 [Clostridia bacterium]|nr:hypothetical protein [Clostridia bacterium]
MKTKLKAKTLLSLILSAVISVAGLVLAFVLGIAGTGGAKQSVVVTYDTYVMLNDTVKEEMLDYCESVYPGTTISVSTSTYGGEIIIEGNVEDKSDEMQAELSARFPDGTFFVSFHETQTKEVSTYSWRALIAGGSLALIAFVYTAIRYRVSQAFAQLIAGALAPALTVALAGLSRIPVGEFVSVAAFFAMALVYVLSFLILGKARTQFKDDVPAEEAVAAVVKSTDKTALIALVSCIVVSLALLRMGVWPALFAIVTVLAAAFVYRFAFPAVLSVFKTVTDEKDKEKKHYTNK